MAKRLKDGEGRLERWRGAVAEMLRAHWPDMAALDAKAATIVGMFDAGARDREVADFLALEEVQAAEPRQSHNELLALAGRLHRLAASRPSV